ncbi:MAG: filamentous hemagglutinin N-terminal domain-containing protein [Nitrospirae bacterium]|nr:MAG: filamentous hemagglutinin N-terminal domain-containing protein [Nitrospirota bacterium]
MRYCKTRETKGLSIFTDGRFCRHTRPRLRHSRAGSGGYPENVVSKKCWIPRSSRGMTKKYCCTILTILSLLWSQTIAYALPRDGVVVGGSSTIAQPNATTMNITQTTAKSIINWQGYNIAANERVQYFQPSSSAISLNRVVGVDPSAIYGQLSANGHVWVINPNGLLIGSGAQINVGSFVASTLNIGNEDFMAGNYKFSTNSPFEKGGLGGILNLGNITTNGGGYVAMISPSITNEGTIKVTPPDPLFAKEGEKGRVILAAADEVTLNFAGNDLIGFTIDKAVIAEQLLTPLLDKGGQRGVTNQGTITAEGGEIALSAKAASSVMKAVINNEGFIEAKSIVSKNGVVRLDGDLVKNTGTISASSADDKTNGGSIDIKGSFIALGGSVRADGAQGGAINVAAEATLSLADKVSAIGTAGKGGSIAYQSGGRTIESSTSHSDASGSTDGGSIFLNANGGLLSSGTYLAKGYSGNGGRIDISGGSVRLFSSTLDASGGAQGGLVRVGGNFQGGKSPDMTAPYIDGFLTRWGAIPSLQSADRTFINDITAINVSAAAGTGGTAIFWSNTQTTMLGSINAAGSTLGGFVEVSSADMLRQTNLLNITGASQLLLDPANITIGDYHTISNWSYQAILGKGYANTSKDLNVDLDASDEFGRYVSLNGAGDRLAIGSYGDDGSGNSVSGSGAVYLFSFTDTNFTGGTLQATIGKGYTGGKNVDVSQLEISDQFGVSVSLNSAGDRLAVGASNDGGLGNSVLSSGAVYLFSFSDTNFTGGTLQATIGKGYIGVKNIDVSQLEASDTFGHSVSLNGAGDRLAVGAHGDDGSGNVASNSGAVYLFSFTDTSFSGGTLQSTIGKGYTGGKNIDLSQLEAVDNFGHAVSLNSSGNRLAAGAQQDDGSGNSVSNSGAVYLFSFTDTSFSGGTLQATIGKGYVGGKNIDVSQLEANDYFGISASLNGAGDRLAVGAYSDSGFGNIAAGSGAVYLFSFTDTNFTGGTLQATIGKGYTGGKNIDVSQLGAGDQLGISVSLNSAGDRLAAGAFRDDGYGNTTADSGAVYLFSFTDTSFSGGVLQGTIGKGYSRGNNINASQLEANETFGYSVSLNGAGDRLAVAAQTDDGYGNSTADSGAVYLFSFADTSFTGGSLQGIIGKGYTGGKNVDVSQLEANDYFGSAVSLNSSGNRLAVGAVGDDGLGNSVSGSGAVYLFSFSDTSFTGGSLQGIIGKGYTGGKNVDVSQLEANDVFGYAVSLNGAGDRLAVGAFFDDGSGNIAANSGAAYLFSFTDTNFSGGTLQSIIGKGYTGGKNVDLNQLEANDYFAISVSLNSTGDRLAVGAYEDDGSGNSVSNSGAVYLFSFTDTSFTGGSLQATIGKGYAGGKNVDVSQLEANDRLGFSVSLNGAGDRLAAGAEADDGSGNSTANSGAIYLFSFSDTSFSGGALQGTIGKGYTGGKNVDLSQLEANDYFGVSVSLNSAGDRLAVGAHGDDGYGNTTADSGAVYLFSFSDTSFSGGVLQGTIGKGYTGGKNVDVRQLEANDYFGRAVSLNNAGDRLAVGAEADGGSGNSTAFSGAVYLFSFSDTNFSGGSLQATIGKGYTGGKNIDVSQLEANDWFGKSVSLNSAGDRLAVGAHGDDGSGNSTVQAGAAYLFSFTDTNFSGGSLQATIGKGYTGGKNVDVSQLEAGDMFGYSVALNSAGDRLAVGASQDDGSGNSVSDSGVVYLFSFTDTSFTGGTLQATIGKGYTGGKNINLAQLEANDVFGVSVSLNSTGDRLAVGAHADDGFGNSVSDSGAVYLFSFTDTNFSGGALQATIGKGYTGGKNVDVSQLEANDLFGVSVSLNSIGDRLAVGAPYDDGFGNSVSGSGAVYLFSFTDNNFSGGTLQATIGKGYTGGKNVDVSQLEANDNFGIAVSLNSAGDRLAVGAPYDDGFGNSAANSGAVYLFSATTESGPNDATGGLNFGSYADKDATIKTAQLAYLLSQGTNITLQASNDITLSSALTANNLSGNGGVLTLQAGRSLLINANITTDNANLNLYANDTTANGVVDAQRSAGSAVITMAGGISINAGTGSVTIEMRSGAGKTNTTSGDITLGNITAGSILVNNQGPTAGTNLSILNATALTASNSGDAIILNAGSSGNFVNNAGATGLSAASGRWLVYSANPTNTTEGVTGYNKRYNTTYPSTTGVGTGNYMLYSIAPTLTVTASDATRAEGEANPTFAYNATGFIDSDTSATALTGSLSTNALLSSTAGTYPISQGTLSNQLGYTINYAAANLTVTAATSTVAQVIQEAIATTTTQSSDSPSSSASTTTSASATSSTASTSTAAQIVVAPEPEKLFVSQATHENTIFIASPTEEDKKKKNITYCK